MSDKPLHSLAPIAAARALGTMTAEEVAFIEDRFGPPTDSRLGAPLTAGDTVWPGGTGPQGGLAYICAGTVREVIVRASDNWSRGRDPRVVNVYGPGCFLGLHQLEALFLEDELGEVPTSDDEDDTEERHLYYANPGRRGTSAGLCVRYLTAEGLAELLAHPTLPTWLKGMWIGCGLGRLGRRFLVEDATRNQRVWDELETHPIFQILGRPALNAMVQAAIPKSPGHAYAAGSGMGVGPSDVYVLPRDNQGRWRASGSTTQDVQLLVEGQAELVLPGEEGEDERVVGMLRPGDFIDLEPIAKTAGAQAPRPLDVYVSDDAWLLAWPVDFLTQLMADNPSARARLERYVAPRIVDSMSDPARVTVIAEGGPTWGHPTDPWSFALGTARWLATDAHIVLVDTRGASRDDAHAFHRGEGHWPEGSSMDPGTTGGEVPGHEVRVDAASSETQFSADTGRLDIVRADDASGLIDLIDRLRGLEGVSDVVVFLPHAQQLPGARAIRNNPEARRIGCDEALLATHLLDGLRVMPHGVLWLCDDVNGWYTLTDEAPDRLIRVDRTTEAFVRAARERAEIYMHHSPRLEVDDRPGNLVDGIMTLGMTQRPLAEGLDKLLDSVDLRIAERSNLARSCARASRMIRERTIGLALGGGGTWGCSHIAVIRALEEARIEVDFVSGTSFGALIGGIYAGGGSEALDHFLGMCPLEAPSRSLKGRFTRPLKRMLRAAVPSIAFLRDEQRAWENPVAGALRRSMIGHPEALDSLVETVVHQAPGSRFEGPAGSPSLRETHIPFLAVASNLTTHEPFVPYHHTLGRAVRAAGSLPPGFPGYWFKGAKMVDGAALANVPAGALRRVGADFVIAVNVVGAAEVRRDVDALSPRDGTWPERITDAIITTWLTLWKAGTAEAERYADVLIDVRIQGIGLAETWRGPEIVEALTTQLAERRVTSLIAERYLLGARERIGPTRIALDYEG